MSQEEQFLDAEAAMKYLGVGKSTVFYLAKRYQVEIYGTEDSNKYFFSKSDLDKIIKKRSEIKPKQPRRVA